MEKVSSPMIAAPYPLVRPPEHPRRTLPSVLALGSSLGIGSAPVLLPTIYRSTRHRTGTEPEPTRHERPAKQALRVARLAAKAVISWNVKPPGYSRHRPSKSTISGALTTGRFSRQPGTRSHCSRNKRLNLHPDPLIKPPLVRTAPASAHYLISCPERRRCFHSEKWRGYFRPGARRRRTCTSCSLPRSSYRTSSPGC